MKTSLQAFLGTLQATSLATRAAIGAAVLAVVALTVFAGWAGGQPRFKLLYSGLDAQHAVSVQAALAAGDIRYEVSQPPSPFVVHVDEAQYYAAQNLVALAGALDTAPQGIQTNGTGASQVFLSAPERAQNVLKREWQELEKQLEELEFVQRAHVSTSTPDPSPLRRSTPMTVAVTLSLRGGASLEKSQAETVAKLVRYRFNVPAENVVVSDQSGRSLYDGAAGTEAGGGAGELFEHKARYDAEIARATNAILERILGQGLAYVVVQSDWSFEHKERVRETVDPKPVVISKTESKSSTPQGSETSATAASGGDASGFGTEHAGVGAATPSASGGKATTQETRTSSVVGRETEHSRVSTPLLERLSVTLFVDESLKDRLASLEPSVKTAVGFDAGRDSFSSMATPFASVTRDPEGKLVTTSAVEADPGPSPMVELLIERGLEVLCAIAFLFVLFKALKSLLRPAAIPAPAGASEADARQLELLAKQEIETLAKTDPEKIGSILARWAAEEEPLAKAGR